MLLLVGLLAAMLAVPAAADHPDGPLVEPTRFAGNDTCEYRVDPPTAGTYVFDVDGTTVTITITRDGDSFGFASSHTVEEVVAKGGPNYNRYDYTGMGVVHDDGLVAPTNPKTGQPYGLSHVSFCFGDAPITPEGTLDVSKTAAGSWDREVSWALDKTVDPDSHSGGPGDTFSSDWQVVATKTDSGPTGFSVTGVIEVGWSGAFAVTVQVDDVLNDGTVAAVDCGDGTNVIEFPAGTAGTTCTYEAFPTDASADVNVVELTVLGDPEGDVTGDLDAQASIIWTENLTGDDEVLLEDDRSGHSETIGSSTTLDYAEGFTCPDIDSGLYVDGLYEETFPNTATLTGPNTDLSDSAGVTLTCRLVFQGETVTGAGEDWSRIPGAPKTWFQYTVGTEGTFDLIQGRKKNDVGDVTVTDNGDGTATLCFELDDPWQLDPNAVGNVKIEPLDATPTAYLSPGQYEFHFTASGSDFCVTVDSGDDGYAIHLDAGYWTSG